MNIHGTDPTNPDTDHDDVNDGTEVGLGDDPNNPPPPTETPTLPTFFHTSNPDDCSGSPSPTQFTVGMQGKSADTRIPVRIREQPHPSAQLVTQIPPTEIFTIIGGPVCDSSDQMRWWQVRYHSVEGWVAEETRAYGGMYPTQRIIQPVDPPP